MDMDQKRHLVAIQRRALKEIDQNVAHEEMLIQEVQKKTDEGKWKRLPKTDRKEILMTPVEKKENIRVGSKRGFQLEAAAKDNPAVREGRKKLENQHDEIEPTSPKVEVAYLKRPQVDK